MHGTPNRDGAELLACLLEAVSREGIDILTAAVATDLHADEGRQGDGRAHPAPGREAVKTSVAARSCSPATGFGGNPEMVREYIPEIADALYFGHAGNRGDAVTWGLELGAEVADMGSYQGHGAVATRTTPTSGGPRSPKAESWSTRTAGASATRTGATRNRRSTSSASPATSRGRSSTQPRTTSRCSSVTSGRRWRSAPSASRSRSTGWPRSPSCPRTHWPGRSLMSTTFSRVERPTPSDGISGTRPRLNRRTTRSG